MAQSLQLARWLQIRMNCVIIISRIADQKANMRKGAALMEQHNYLKTARLELKPLDEKDRESMIRLAEDRQIKKTYMFPDFADRAQKDAFYDRLLALCESGKRFIFGIYLQGKLIGMLNETETDGKSIELGYFIDPEYWNRGYASEALVTAIDELFRRGFKRVCAGYFEGNDASRRVMEKSGMKPTKEEAVISYRGVDHRCLFCEITHE